MLWSFYPTSQTILWSKHFFSVDITISVLRMYQSRISNTSNKTPAGKLLHFYVLACMVTDDIHQNKWTSKGEHRVCWVYEYKNRQKIQ